MAPRENLPLTHYADVKMGSKISNIFHFFIVDRSIQNSVYRRKIYNQNCFSDELFFHICHTFRINYSFVDSDFFKLNIYIFSTFFISITNEPSLDQIFPYYCKIKRENVFVNDVFFSFGPYFSNTKRVFKF